MTGNKDNEDGACKPQWVHHNKLLSYCSKGVHAVADEAQAAQEKAGRAEPACAHRQCLFALRSR